ncbi:hypothetical protein [Bacillus sp. 71mf]|nr:hypothetical protein [Bacillus sp. 71mf]
MIVIIKYVLNNETTSGFASYNMYIKEGESAAFIIKSTLFERDKRMESWLKRNCFICGKEIYRCEKPDPIEELKKQNEELAASLEQCMRLLYNIQKNVSKKTEKSALPPLFSLGDKIEVFDGETSIEGIFIECINEWLYWINVDYDLTISHIKSVKRIIKKESIQKGYV